MSLRLAYEWTRDCLAIVGAAAVALFVLLMAAVMAPMSAQPPETPKKVTLHNASTLLYQAGLANQPTRFIGGEITPWTEGRHVEAYCLRFTTAPRGEQWRPLAGLDPSFTRLVDAGMDSAHAALACVPGRSEAAARGLRVRVMSAHFEQPYSDEVTAALHDPLSGDVYLLHARLPSAPPPPPPD